MHVVCVAISDQRRELIIFLNSMNKGYGIAQYTCLLDILSPSEHLDEAENLVDQMPFQHDGPTWITFLSACEQ